MDRVCYVMLPVFETRRPIRVVTLNDFILCQTFIFPSDVHSKCEDFFIFKYCLYEHVGKGREYRFAL